MENQFLKFRYQTFSSATNRVTGETLLWRYLTFEEFIWMIENSGLHHIRLDRLEDRFEGSVTKFYAENRGSEHPPTRDVIRSTEPFFNRRSLFRSYVNCWHSSEYESAAMWKVYSRQNAGVAIVSTLSRLQESVLLPPETEFGLLGPVEYLDFEKHSMMGLTGCQVRPGFAKQKSFEFEREVRCLICINPDQGEKTISMSEEYLEQVKMRTPLGVIAKVDMKKLINRIYTSPLSPPWFNEIVQSAAGRAGLGNVVVKSGLNDDPIY